MGACVLGDPSKTGPAKGVPFGYPSCARLINQHAAAAAPAASSDRVLLATQARRLHTNRPKTMPRVDPRAPANGCMRPRHRPQSTQEMSARAGRRRRGRVGRPSPTTTHERDRPRSTHLHQRAGCDMPRSRGWKLQGRPPRGGPHRPAKPHDKWQGRRGRRGGGENARGGERLPGARCCNDPARAGQAWLGGCFGGEKARKKDERLGTEPSRPLLRGPGGHGFCHDAFGVFIRIDSIRFDSIKHLI